MSNTTLDGGQARWLQKYYLVRAIVSLVWILLALSLGRENVLVGALLLVLYPAWDALANFVDGIKSGGLQNNAAQRTNGFVSLGVALAIGLALAFGTRAAIGVFGLWAMAAGLFQLAAAVQRWKTSGGQWAMVLSGAQSALAGGFFVKQATDGVALDASVVAPYAAFGAFYFIVSAVWLAVKHSRRPAGYGR
ncbi:hypothetical protein BJP27_10525 [Pseudomonas oryzihabitans]|nr:hypothetical protein BJP27_10525 [Pseudomonas psychrotolerans]